MLHPLRRLPDHEVLFVERYRALLRMALKLTRDAHDAEDLVQEAFLRFTLVKPPLEGVQHLDGYLFGLLRNMYLSQVRRRARAAETPLSIFEYDSLEIGLGAVGSAAWLDTCDTLRAACRYGCARMHESKAGSVFLLRFFLGYLPSEIARLTRLSPAIVDALVFRARREIKEHLLRPQPRTAIATLGRTIAAASGPQDRREPVDEDPAGERLVRDLRAIVFGAPHDRCWSRGDLRGHYDANAGPLSKETLAGLVGCSSCLDRVNAHLGLAPLSTRFPTDTLGPGHRGGGRGGGGGGGDMGGLESTSARPGASRGMRARYEHRPRELRVAVNGFVLGSHTLGSEPSDLTLTVNLAEPIAFVELFGEQDLCMLFLEVAAPPEGPAHHVRRTELSDGRHAELAVTFDGPWPTVRASYVDPSLDPQTRAIADADDEEAGHAADPNRTSAVLPDTDADADARESAERPRPTPWLATIRWRSLPTAIAVLAVVTWLLFWTPGTQVSAAERIAQAIAWIVHELWPSSAKTMDPPTPERERPVPSASGTPAAPEAHPRSSVAAATAPLTPDRRTAVELQALAALQQVGAYLGQEVALGPTDRAIVRLHATVDTPARQVALRRALAPLLRLPEVRADVIALNAVARAARPVDVTTATGTDQAFAFVREPFPMFERVQAYLRSQREARGDSASAPTPTTVPAPAPAPAAALDADVHAFAMAILERSRRASQHAWALKHLGDRFPASVIEQASPGTRATWEAVVRTHAQAYRDALVPLRRDLQAVLALDRTSSGGAGARAPDPADTMSGPWSRFARLLDRHRDQDAAVQAAFTIQPAGEDAADVLQTTAFWHLFDAADALAADIARNPSGSPHPED